MKTPLSRRDKAMTGCLILDANGLAVVDDVWLKQEDAELIVLAVNAHEALVSALQRLVKGWDTDEQDSQYRIGFYAALLPSERQRD